MTPVFGSCVRGFLIAGLACHSPVLLAQPPAEPARAGDTLQEVVVTARKQQETLQDAPLAVTAFTSESIAERGIVDLNALAGVQCGVESGTAYCLDGVYYPSDMQALDFNSLERVEIIKGPQSAL